ncbi:hypothetical protein NYE47_12160 [Paenibacillus sp. FSL H7-0941]|uniref:hypothetical protein n=1 Tax=Paenibacillus sp. FSL H7-0941 TaxID=2975351 RepID=UPI0030FB222B
MRITTGNRNAEETLNEGEQEHEDERFCRCTAVKGTTADSDSRGAFCAGPARSSYAGPGCGNSIGRQPSTRHRDQGTVGPSDSLCHSSG